MQYNYDLSQTTIMIADDSPSMRRLLKTILEAFGAGTILTAESGEDAMAQFRKTSPDLLLVDWNMTPMDGISLARTIRQDPFSPNPYIPVVLLTGHTDFRRVIEAREAGITEVMSKPVIPAKLYQRLVTIIDRPRSFVRTTDYFGPDRRRRARKDYPGSERRAAAAGIAQQVGMAG